MTLFLRIATQMNVAPALAEVESQPELWGQYPERLIVPNSPHAQSQDIWLRFRPRAELTDPAKCGEPHFPVFYPAWDRLPGLHPLVFDIMARVKATSLGGILMTKIPPGKAILPHTDSGWHPTFNDTKAYVILKANDLCFNRCLDETVIMQPGEAWLFRNDIVHSVENHGATDRIALIITMRTK
jgi:hypothetical protein